MWLLLFVVGSVGCTCAPGEIPEPDTTTDTATTSTDDLPCGIDCKSIATPQCTQAVCNLGQEIGPLDTCVVVPLPAGAGCDDGQFCTIGDACNGSGTCGGGSENECGLGSSPCVAVVCYEESKSCDVTPVNDGTACTPTDLCEVDGVCQLGECYGEPKDCTFSPLNECNKVTCEPATGNCTGVPDADKDDAPCVLTGDLCITNRTCKSGQCGGGTPIDCSGLDVGCQVGACDPDTGICDPKPAPVGTVCTEGLNECDAGACDVKGTCVASPAPNGVACNDHNACTMTDKCTTGACGGSPVGDCVLYLNEGFEVCPNGWTFGGGEWECGTPENVGPLEAHTGEGVIATQIDGVYHVSQIYSVAVANSPPIDLTEAINPVVSFWAWDHTEGGSYDGWNLRVSTNNGQSFSVVQSVTPPYPLTIANQPAWGGNHSAKGWQSYSADLTAYAGQTILLRFSFHSDGATVFPGVYVDDVVVAEPQQSPLFITTTSPLLDAYQKTTWSTQMVRTGGSSNAVWTITPGGVNTSWLVIDPATGVLSGTPQAADVGPVTISVHVEESGWPLNYADATFTFNVHKAVYYTSFEGACPDNWTLTGDWQCGVPTNVGPATAYVGPQCLGTQLAGLYSNDQTWASTTATSPDIDLTGAVSPKLAFRMWVDTEGSDYDGVNLQISTDGGMTYANPDSLVPPPPLTIEGRPAWGGQQSALGWQLIEADLSSYAGQTIRLRFSCQSDASLNFAGVYVDHFLID